MIHPMKWYSIPELMRMGEEGFFPIKERPTIQRLIDQGALHAVNISSLPKKPTFKLKGEDILKFLDSRGTYELKKIDGKHYSSKKYDFVWQEKNSKKKIKNSETVNRKEE